jgi:phage tail-like protein
MPESLDYRYLNREGRWLDFDWSGLELGDDGTLRLESLPLLAGDPPAGLATLAAPELPSGVAVAHGDVYFSDPAVHRLSVVERCDGVARPAACLTGPGSGPGQLRGPRGLLFDPRRNALLVADSGNGRIQLLALPDLRLTESWTAGGALVEPVSLASDSEGNVYAADVGAHAVQKLDTLGQASPAFAAAVAGYEDLAPAEVAVGTLDGDKRLFILDAGTGRIHVLDLDGVRQGGWDTGIASPVGLAIVGTRLVIGDGDARRLAVFRLDGTRIGVAHGYEGPVAAVAGDGRGGLLVHPGAPLVPLRLDAAGAYGTRGVLWGGPFANPSVRSKPRHRIRARLGSQGANAHLQLFVGTQPAGSAKLQVDAGAADLFADAVWHRVAPDASETLVPGEFGDEVWLGLVFTSEGLSSPALEQIRVDFAYETMLQYLPALYSRDPDSAELLARWLTLFESGFDDTQAGIERLPLLFDPAAAPPEWLPWLARWLALELPDSWDEERRRRELATAFERDALRGTPEGLRAAIASEAGVEALIEEPIVQTGWWSLAAEDAPPAQSALSVLGVGTVLAAAEAQGAVAGTTAVLDGSFLSPQDEYARPLFAEVAHRFTVRLYRGRSYSDEAATTVRAVLERERPAHTAYHVCVVEPRMRVGMQARVGVDAIVAGPAEPTLLEAGGEAGIVLAGPAPERLGIDTDVGRMQLTETGTDS